MLDVERRAEAAFLGFRSLMDMPVMLTGLTKTETAILMELSADDASEADGDRCYTGTQLARHLRLSPGGVSQVISGLVDKGHVRRVPDTNDRRVVHVELTPSGAAIGRHLRMGFRKLMSVILHGLGPEDAKTFVTLLERASAISSRIMKKAHEAHREGRDPSEVLEKEDECENTYGI